MLFKNCNRKLKPGRTVKKSDLNDSGPIVRNLEV